MGKIVLEGIQNARDLGGIRTKDGRELKEKALIRSGTLYTATEADICKLKEEYRLSMIIDLRTERERKSMPQPCVKDVSTIWNPVYMENIQGLHQLSQEEREILEIYGKKMCIGDPTSKFFDADDYMARMYHKFVNNQVVQKQLKQLFSLLMNNRDGSILWYCSAGKDRSGIVAALVLYALGVSKEEIIKDYEASAEAPDDTINLIIEKLLPEGMGKYKEYRDAVRKLFGAKRCYIESFFKAIENDYVSIDNYLQKALELHVDNLVRLKTLYLK